MLYKKIQMIIQRIGICGRFMLQTTGQMLKSNAVVLAQEIRFGPNHFHTLKQEVDTGSNGKQIIVKLHT